MAEHEHRDVLPRDGLHGSHEDARLLGLDRVLDGRRDVVDDNDDRQPRPVRARLRYLAVDARRLRLLGERLAILHAHQRAFVHRHQHEPRRMRGLHRHALVPGAQVALDVLRAFITDEDPDAGAAINVAQPLFERTEIEVAHVGRAGRGERCGESRLAGAGAAAQQRHVAFVQQERDDGDVGKVALGPLLDRPRHRGQRNIPRDEILTIQKIAERCFRIGTANERRGAEAATPRGADFLERQTDRYPVLEQDHLGDVGAERSFGHELAEREGGDVEFRIAFAVRGALQALADLLDARNDGPSRRIVARVAIGVEFSSGI